VYKCSDLAWNNIDTLLIWVDKKNLMEFLLFSIYYLYNYYMVCALLSHTYHVMSCDCNYVTLSHTPSYVVSPKEKEKKSKYE